MNLEDLPRVGIAGIIFSPESKILLGKRIDNKNPHGNGVWQFPGGHLKRNEDYCDGVLREIKEETGLSEGIQLVKNSPVESTNDISKISGTHYVTLFFEARYSGTEAPSVMESDKCESWRWYDWKDIESMKSELFLPIQNLIDLGYRPFR